MAFRYHGNLGHHIDRDRGSHGSSIIEILCVPMLFQRTIGKKMNLSAIVDWRIQKDGSMGRARVTPT